MIGLLALLLAGAAPVARAPTPADNEARLAMRDFSRCVADAAPAEAAALLAMDFRTPAYDAALRKLADGHKLCLGFYRRGQFAAVLFAGGLAERMIEREHVDVARTIAFDAARPAVASRGELETMALCLSFQHPADVATLLATRPASADEDHASAAVIADLPSCLAAGVPLHITRPGLRAVLATAAYRIIHINAAPVAPAGGH